jgi:hypothetical protein
MLSFRRIAAGSYDIHRPAGIIGRIDRTPGGLWDWTWSDRLLQAEASGRAATLKAAKEAAQMRWAANKPWPNEVQLNKVMAYIGDRLGRYTMDREADQVKYVLDAAPMGELNPALEAAVATARYMDGTDNLAEYTRKLRKLIGDTMEMF